MDESLEQKEENLLPDEEDSDVVEKEGIDENAPVMEKPFDPTKINIETKTPSLDTLIKRMERNSIEMDTTTYFQREADLWDRGQQSRLIESILIRFPLPAFFFDATDDNRWLVVDGLQRLSSIRNFCIVKDPNKQLRLTNLEFLTQLNGKTWGELDGNLQRTIEETQVVIYKIMPGTPYDVKFNIFKRINTGGLVLEPQEIRHALFQGKPAQFIERLAKNESFRKATGGRIPTRRMLDRDFVNRFLAFYLIGYENYQPDLDTFMSKGMAMINDKSEDELQKIEDNFTKAMDLSYGIFGKDAFRKKGYESNSWFPINKALFDALATQFALLSDDKREKLIEKQNTFKFYLQVEFDYTTDFYKSISSSTGEKGKVLYRHHYIDYLINECTNES